jgi:tetratricopeptide (TPR) repeat protein
MNSERGRKVQGQAEHARESGDFVKALALTDQATVIYAEDNDLQGLSEVQSSRLLTFRHLFEQTEKDEYLILAKHAAEAGVEIAEKANQPEALSMPYFNLAKAYESLSQLDLAVSYYEKAIDSKEKFPGNYHNRPGVLADMRIHKAIAQYKDGKEAALTDALRAVEDLQSSDETRYNKDVWLSGAHMKIAEVLVASNSDEAKTHIETAQRIVDANPELLLRQKQLAKLRKKLSI